ncbi:MAG TPA: hypothetical protein VGQ59_01870 [Cyclobacteriaceae bacterium]|jgi:hypothetical protein|nr:hypothetical protein [Cyclobacteriaceae bacterium]
MIPFTGLDFPFNRVGIPQKKIQFAPDTYVFNFGGTPIELVNTFRQYYGPTMGAFEAAEKNGKEQALQHELETLFSTQNQSQELEKTTIHATYLRVTIVV